MENKFLVYLKKYSFLIKFLISVLILYFVFKKIDFINVYQILKGITAKDILILILLNFVSFLIMVAKWRVLLIKHIKISYMKLASIYLASDFVNLFFLGTLGGEAYKVLYSKDKKAVFFTSIFDRLYSFKAYLLVACFLFIVYFNQHYAIAILVFFVFITMGYYLYLPILNFFKNDKIIKLLEYAKLKRRELALHNLLSIAYLISYAIRVWYVFLIFGYQINLYVLIIFSALVVVAISIPISIQGLGVREYLFLQFALFFAISIEVATAASLLIYFTGLIYRLFGIVPFLTIKKP